MLQWHPLHHPGTAQSSRCPILEVSAMPACRLALSTAVILMCCPGLLAQQPDARTKAREQAARSFLELLNGGDFAKATEQFDATMKKKLPPDELKKVWGTVTGQAGAYKKPLGSRVEAAGRNQAGVVTCR